MTNSVAREIARYQSGRVRHPDLDDVSLFVELLLEWSPAEVDEAAALLLFLVQSAPARDAVLLQWATDLATGDRLWQSEVDDQTVSDLKLGIGPRPDPARLDRGTAVVEAGAGGCSAAHGAGGALHARVVAVGPLELAVALGLRACSIRSLKN